MLMKMYRGRKPRGEDPSERLARHQLFHQVRFSKARLCASSLYLSSLDSSSSSSMLAPYSSFPLAIRPLVLSSLVLQRLQIYPGPLKVARSLSMLQRTTVPRQSSHSHRRYLPSGINQLNARLLEASLSLKPILLAFLCFPILFPPARRV